MPREKLKVGLNSSALKEFGGFLSLEDVQPDFVELSLAEIRPEDWDNAVKKLEGVEITIHAPYQNSPVRETRIDFASFTGLKVAEKVLRFAGKVNASVVVFHCGDMKWNGKSVENVIRSLKELKSEVPVVVENLYSDESGNSRVGETPEEMLRILENTDVDMNLDVGHAYIASLQWRRGILEEFLDELKDYIAHMHVHNNFGIWSKPYDDHNPIFRGLIDYGKLRGKLRRTKARMAVLEIKRGTPEEVRQSMAFLRSF